ncbi:MAG: tetratricopeptide repeat protein, partial [Bacteroidales bacterium]|nr:tetratricopeptide repeat protein [Bacteroidales bacterium]
SESLRLYTEAIKYDINNVDALKNRGNIYSYIKDFSNALNDYHAAILLSPEDGGLYLNIANIQHQLGQVDSACTNWSIAVELGKSDANKMLEKYCK